LADWTRDDEDDKDPVVLEKKLWCSETSAIASRSQFESGARRLGYMKPSRRNHGGITDESAVLLIVLELDSSWIEFREPSERLPLE